MQPVSDLSIPRVSPGVTVSDVLFNTAVCIFGTWQPHHKWKKGSPEWGHNCFMFPNLLDHRRLTLNNQNTCFQTAHLVLPLLRWKDQEVLDRREIAPRSKRWRHLSGRGEWFSIDKCCRAVCVCFEETSSGGILYSMMHENMFTITIDSYILFGRFIFAKRMCFN